MTKIFDGKIKASSSDLMAHQVVSRWGVEKGIILLEHFSIQLLLGSGNAAITRSGFSIRLPQAQAIRQSLEVAKIFDGKIKASSSNLMAHQVVSRWGGEERNYFT
ncbi:MAG: hypothetical protein MUC81_04995 [Bacteroidia bacterium]|jgi:hypothetical protein|nr:hypothetical protein [Bacteroidia bacterium]